jgi:hypothetical protein
MGGKGTGGPDAWTLGPAGQDDRLLRAGHRRGGGAGRGRGGGDRAAAAGVWDRPGHPGAADRQRLRQYRHGARRQARPAADCPRDAARRSRAAVGARPGPGHRRRHRRRRHLQARQTAPGPGGAPAGARWAGGGQLQPGPLPGRWPAGGPRHGRPAGQGPRPAAHSMGQARRPHPDPHPERGGAVGGRAGAPSRRGGQAATQAPRHSRPARRGVRAAPRRRQARRGAELVERPGAAAWARAAGAGRGHPGWAGVRAAVDPAAHRTAAAAGRHHRRGRPGRLPAAPGGGRR